MAQNDAAKAQAAKEDRERAARLEAAKAEVERFEMQKKIEAAAAAEAALIKAQMLDLERRMGLQQRGVAPAANLNPPQPPAAKAGNDVKINVEVELNPAQQQMLDQFKPLLKLELAFAARACKLDDAQRKLLADSGKEYLKSMVTGGVAGGAANLGGRIVFGGQQIVVRNEGGRVLTVRMPTNPRKQLQDHMAVIVNAKLPAEIAAQYMKEHAKRAEFQKRAAIDNTITMIDKKLMLSDAQRDQIGAALAKAWKDVELPDLQTFLNANEYLPTFPETCILPYLRPAQKAVWQTREPQTTIRFGFVGPAVQFDEVVPFR